MRTVPASLRVVLDSVEPQAPREPFGGRVHLQPIPWGKRDEALGRLVCRHIEDANPAIVIRYNPITHSRLSRLLRSCGVLPA